MNCGAETTARYCPQCGQSSGTQRITFRESLNEIVARLLEFDGKFPRTLRDLTIRPGQVAREYIAGNRVKYCTPVGYFFLMITLLLVLLSLLDLDYVEQIQSKQNAFQLSSSNARITDLMAHWIASNIKWVVFLAIPFQAFAARFLFFRRSGLNLTEHTVPLFYTTGHLFWLSMLSFVYRKISGELPPAYFGLLSLLFFGFTYLTFFPDRPRVTTFLKGIGVYLGGQVLFMVAASALAVLVMLVLALVDPAALESLRSFKAPP
ncbi:MAG: DUF3667 domain-containing protein [Planctomycetes bacterium]|nr:DUF3667 domain-containing protein [Planctomycetota bacterium]